MRKKAILAACFLSLTTIGGWSQDASYIHNLDILKKMFANDGIIIKTGIDAAGTQNLAVLANGGFGGYFPLQAVAKAGVPTVLRVYTDKTYDCSRSFILPDLKQRAILPAKGMKAFTIPPQKKGATLFGTCGMGMYTFQIRFE